LHALCCLCSDFQDEVHGLLDALLLLLLPQPTAFTAPAAAATTHRTCTLFAASASISRMTSMDCLMRSGSSQDSMATNRSPTGMPAAAAAAAAAAAGNDTDSIMARTVNWYGT
jgi:hypothetical protein